MTTTSTILVAVLLGASGCGGCHADSNGDASTSDAGRVGPWADSPEAQAPAAADTWQKVPEARPTRVGVSHILIAYQGAEGAPKTVSRSKDAAQTRAAEVKRKLGEAPGSFADLAKEYSDDSVTQKLGGALGNIEEWVMPEAFFTAATALKVDGISDVIETPRGFHIIHRTK